MRVASNVRAGGPDVARADQALVLQKFGGHRVCFYESLFLCTRQSLSICCLSDRLCLFGSLVGVPLPFRGIQRLASVNRHTVEGGPIMGPGGPDEGVETGNTHTRQAG